MHKAPPTYGRPIFIEPPKSNFKCRMRLPAIAQMLFVKSNLVYVFKTRYLRIDAM